MYVQDFTKSARWAAKSRGRVQRHPDWLAMATGVLERAGHTCTLVDSQAKNMPFEDFNQVYTAYMFDLTIIWVSTPSIYSDIKWAEKIKRRWGCKVFLVGAHVSALPKETMELSDSIDGVCIGEFDYTIRDIADKLSKTENISDVPGIIYRDGDTIHATKSRSPIINLDDLPFPAWHHIDINDYPDAGKKFPFITMISSRGCPNACTFCQYRFTLEKGPYRKMSPKRMISEMRHNLELFPDLKEIMIEDDTLVSDMNKDHLIEFLDEFEKSGLDITWSCNARADLTDIGILKRMKKLGCRMICTGYEFGSQCMLDAVNKNNTIESMKAFAKATRKAGLKVNGCFMIGGPGETPETAQKTIDLALELNPNTCQFSSLVPYPGTPFYTWANSHGYITANDWTEWVDLNFEQATVLSYPDFPKEEINKYINKGLKSFYLRPKKMAELGMNVRSLSDIKRLIHGFKSALDSFILKKNGGN